MNTSMMRLLACVVFVSLSASVTAEPVGSKAIKCSVILTADPVGTYSLQGAKRHKVFILNDRLGTWKYWDDELGVASPICGQLNCTVAYGAKKIQAKFTGSIFVQRELDRVNGGYSEVMKTSTTTYREAGSCVAVPLPSSSAAKTKF